MEITKVPFTTGQLIRQMVRLAHTLQTVPEDERQRAILLAKTEAQYHLSDLADQCRHDPHTGGASSNDASP